MNIALIGYGKMGKEIEQFAYKKNHEIVCIIDSQEDWNTKTEDLKKADVAIEFTQPHLAIENIYKCFEQNIPVVCGTTGWLDNIENVRQKCLEGGNSIVYSSNFSIGVNLFFKVNEYLAQLMNPHTLYDVEIEEIHHTQKLDAPSGTAISLANQITSNLERKLNWKLEDGDKMEDLVINSLRINDVTGIHSVQYTSEIDCITIKHEAYNRRGFAAGAIFSAEWLVNNKGGCFDFKNILFNKV